ncbi:MAG: hypothetical protein JST04_02435 [Bdellovibrionales bacterium]|nr:hypothetical protein [Bdellovibrionales bacterium]
MAVTLGLALLVGCSSARMKDTEIDAKFRAGDYVGAAERAQKGFEKETLEGKDGLLYLLDLGLSLHTAGKYDESIKYFRLADQAVEIKDYTSLSTEASTLLVSDTVKQYKGEDFENVLISAYLAMDYAMIGKREDAIVEAKRVNRKLYLMTTEGKRNYKQNAFARYLSGTLYEADRNWNDANVDYKLVADLLPDWSGIGRDLWAMAWKLKNRDDLARLEEKYKITDKEKAELKRRVSPERPGEIVVIFQNGISPKKVPEPNFPSVPKFEPRYNPVTGGEAIVTNAASGAEVGREKTSKLMDVEAVAIQNLKEKWGGILAKKIGGVVAKHAIGAVIDSKTNNSGIGALLAYAMYAADQADTRSWNLLPKDLEVARIPVTEGTYSVRIQPIGIPGALPPKTVQIKNGEKIFVNFRYMP